MGKNSEWFKFDIAASLINKLMLCFTLVIVLIVAATMGPTLYLFSDTMQKINEDKALQGVEGLASIIEIYKQDALKHGLVLADKQMLVSALEEKNTVKIIDILKPAVEKAELDFVTMTDNKGIVVAQLGSLVEKGDDLRNTSNIRKVLRGQTTEGIESGNNMKIAILAGVPVKNTQGETVGTLSAGYNLENNKIVDQVKVMFNTDATIFLGDVRLSTTIVKDGKRIVGTTLNENIDNKVLGQGQKYIGQTEIIGEQYVTAYMPLIGMDKKPIGVIFAGQKVVETITARNKLIYIVASVVLVVMILVAFLAMFMARGIVNPIKIIAKAAGLVADGDLTQSVEITSKDEVGMMAKAFNHMVRQLNHLIVALDSELKERKRIEEIVKQSEELYRLLAENATDVIWTMDLNGRFTYISPSVKRQRGYTVDEALKQTADEWLTHSSLVLSRHNLQCVMDMVKVGQRVDSRRLELEVRCKDGSVVWVEETCNGIYNSTGEILGILGVDRDITDERQLERRIHHDVQLAGRLQKNLLPQDTANELFTIRTVYVPLREVSGDFYNYLLDSGGVLRGYVSDISGHGIATALNSAAVRFILDEALDKKLTLASAQDVNGRLLESMSEEIFVALIMFEFDFRENTVTLVTGGINHLLSYSQDVDGLVTIPGGLFGLFEMADLSIVKMPIRVSDTFYFTTDGLMDLIKGQLIESVDDFDKTVEFLEKRAQQNPREDDCSALCIKIESFRKKSKGDN